MTRAAWILFFLATGAAAEESVRWGGSFEGARKASAESGKPLISLTSTSFKLLGNPAACRGHKTDGISPVESRSITPQGGELVALPFGRPRGSTPWSV